LECFPLLLFLFDYPTSHAAGEGKPSFSLVDGDRRVSGENNAREHSELKRDFYFTIVEIEKVTTVFCVFERVAEMVIQIF